MKTYFQTDQFSHSMHRSFYTIVFFISFLCAVLASCQRTQENQKKTKEWFQNDAKKIRILATTAHVSNLVKEVGGDHVTVLELIQGESDPHSYQLVKGDDEKFTAADLVFYSGLGLEHGPSLTHQLTQSQAISVGDRIKNIDPSYALDIGGTLDPHMWMDVSLWAKGAYIIAEALAEKYPDFAALFRNNASRFYSELLILDQKGRDLFQSLSEDERYLVTTHDAFKYFTRRYLANTSEQESGEWQKRCKAPEGLAPDSQISTQDILDIAEYIIAHKVPVMFAEVGINQDSLQKLKEVLFEKGYSIRIVDEELYSDSMGDEGSQAGSYSGMIWYNMQTIYRHISSHKKEMKSL